MGAALQPGGQVTWLHTPRCGYGYVYPVDGVVEKVGKTQVQIHVKKKNGEEVLRRVSQQNLRKK